MCTDCIISGVAIAVAVIAMSQGPELEENQTCLDKNL